MDAVAADIHEADIVDTSCDWDCESDEENSDDDDDDDDDEDEKDADELSEWLHCGVE